MLSKGGKKMEIIGIIAEYNPLHNGHIYHINKIKEIFPSSLIVLVLNGYFLERGTISIQTKEEKTRLALKYGVDIVIELPFFFGSNSADTFATASVELLHHMGVTKLIFGSESNDIELLKKIASIQLDHMFNKRLQEELRKGTNYPTALNKAIGIPLNDPNDLLGVSYIKAIIKNNYDIKPLTIKRTNNYHDTSLDNEIVSASNIRQKLIDGLDISKYIPEGHVVNINEKLFFTLLKAKIITEHDLGQYLTVDEGLENRLKKLINNCFCFNDLIQAIKTKRYTYNRLMRMFIHILIGLKKEDMNKISHNEYIRLLGFNDMGAKYIRKIKNTMEIPLISKFSTFESVICEYELKAASIYSLISNENVLDFELANKPIQKN